MPVHSRFLLIGRNDYICLIFSMFRRKAVSIKIRLCMSVFWVLFTHWFLFIPGFPQPVAVYTLDSKTGARDISPGRNIPGKSYNIRYAPGPYGQPGESTEFFGRRNSYIRFPNSGKLDVKDSITLLAWIFPIGRGPIFEYFRGMRFWVVRSDTLYVQFKRRNGRPTRALIKRRLYPRRWNYVGCTYNQRTGIATLWVDSRPVLTQNIKRIRLATKTTAYMGGTFRGRIACMQVYSKALTGPQIKKVKNLCNKPGEL